MLFPPPNKLAIPENSPPSPAMLLSPPVRALDIPPEAVCFIRLVNMLELLVVAVREFDGRPKLIGTAVSFPVRDGVRMSLKEGGLLILLEVLEEEPDSTVALSDLEKLRPSTFGVPIPVTRPARPFLLFAIFNLQL